MAILRGPDRYTLAEGRLAALPTGGRRDAAICRILHEAIPTYSWVGIYRPVGDGLVLAVWAGGGEPRAPRLCASERPEQWEENDLLGAARSGRFSPTARAETTIPFDSTAGTGLLAIASDHRGAFGPADRDLLGRAAALLSERGR